MCIWLQNIQRICESGFRNFEQIRFLNTGLRKTILVIMYFNYYYKHYLFLKASAHLF